jgi:hypothetical protein
MRRSVTANKSTVEIAQPSNKQPINKNISFKGFVILQGALRLTSGKFGKYQAKVKRP